MSNLTAGDIYGTPTSRLVEQLWDACAEFMKRREQLMRQRKDRRDLLRAVQPVAAGNNPDRQLLTAVAAEETMPRYLYLNTTQWEQEAQPDLATFVYQMGLKVLTSRWIPPDSGHLTHDEFNPDEIGKALSRGQKIPFGI